MGLKPRAIRVRIGELVLEGYSPADAPRIGAAVERELVLLFAERGVPAALAAGGSLAAVAGGSFMHEPRATPVSVGSAVARAVYSGLEP